MSNADSNSKTPSLGQVWQVPVLLFSLVLLGLGWYLALPGDSPPDRSRQLDQVRQLISASRFDEAIDLLDRVWAEAGPDAPATDDAEAGPPLTASQQIRWHLLRGDAIHFAQKVHGWDKPENHRRIIDAYEAARDLGHTLDAPRVERLAEAHLALDQPDKVDQLVDEPDTPATPESRQQLQRQTLAAMLDSDQPLEAKLRAIGDYLDTEALARAHRVWAVARQAELLLEHGQPAAAARRLYAWLQKLDFAESADLGELMVLLGLADLELGERRDAERWFIAAREQLPEADPLHGQAMWGLGRIRFDEDNIVEAWELFAGTVKDFPDSRALLPALIGKAEAEARLHRFDDALASYDRAIDHVDQAIAAPPQAGQLADSLDAQYSRQFATGDFENALAFARRLARLRDDDHDLPPSLLRKLALAHERLASQAVGLLDPSAAGDGSQAGADPPVDLAARIEAAEHYEKAADYYQRHADAVAATDPAAYGESLWQAADAFDQAGMPDHAIGVFERYLEARPEDPRRVEALFRLGQAYQAAARYDKAVERYRRLIEDHPKSQFAYRSLVPLARCYLDMGPDHWAQAEHVLNSVVKDHPALRPDSKPYREALIELGRLHYRRADEGDFERAIESLGEAVERYPDDPQLPQTLFQLADAYRKSVDRIDQQLEQPLNPDRRSAFQAERARRLAEAQKAFGRVIDLYEAMAADARSKLQNLYLRNSYFYRADCAYDLGRHEGPDGAIELYQRAARRYEGEPAVLIAQVQIFNSYCEMQRYDLARTANARAREYLKSIEDDAWDDPNLPMTREHWQRWLEWTDELSMIDRSAAATP